MERTKACRDCGGRMERGHVIDTGYGTYSVTRWWKGPPVKSWLSGLKFKEKEGKEIQSFRCNRCGLLQSYVPNA